MADPPGGRGGPVARPAEPGASGAGGRLLERGGELARLDAAIASAAAGGGRVVVLEGHAGLGKSALLDAAAERAGDAGLRRLRAWGAPLEAHHPFGLARQLLEPALAGRDAAARAALLDGPAALAAPAIGGAPLPPAPAGDDVAFPIVHGLHWLLANLAAEAPTALLVDDAHWADDGSLRWLAYVAPRLRALPLLLVVATRPAGERPESAGAVTPGRAAARASAAANGAVAAQALAALTAAGELLLPQPLGAEAATALLGELLDTAPSTAFAGACRAATAGNPFLLRELARAVAAEELTPDDAAVARLTAMRPASFARGARARVAPLPPAAAQLAQAVAVLGDGVELAVAAAAAGLTDAAAAEAADTLAAAGLLRPQRPLGFVHALLGAAVADDVPAARRSALHAAAASALAERGADPAVVGAHLLETDPAGDDWTVERLQAAAWAAAGAGAPEVARRLLERALREPPPAPLRGPLLLALGAAQARIGVGDAPAAAVDRLRSALPLLADPAARALCRAELGQALLLAGDPPAAVDVLVEALRELPPEARELGFLLQGVLGIASYAAPEARARVPEDVWRFRGDASRPRDAQDRTWAAHLAVATALHGGTAAEAVALARTALPAHVLFDDSAADSPHAYNAAFAFLVCDELGVAQAIHTHAIDGAGRRGSLRALGMASTFRAAARLHGGDVAGAIDDGRTALEAIDSGRLTLGLHAASAFLATALLEAGEPDEAAVVVARARDAAGVPDAILRDYLLAVESRLRLEAGAPAEALALAEQVGRRQRAWGVERPVMVHWRGDAALALAALGRGEEALALAEQELALARAWGGTRAIAAALRRLGTLRGDAEPLREAAALLAGSELRLEQARSLVELGALLRRGGVRGPAREPLREGLALARRCGATALARQAHAELEASGLTVRKILRGGRAELTPSELRVARLAAGGRGNREIAATLFVTVRTVETHLRRVYAKLDVDGRGELAAALDGGDGA